MTHLLYIALASFAIGAAVGICLWNTPRCHVCGKPRRKDGLVCERCSRRGKA